MRLYPTKRFFEWLLLLAWFGWSSTGCTPALFPPKRQVYIPPEYQTPLPKAKSVKASKPDSDILEAEKKKETKSGTGSAKKEIPGPVLQPYADIQEKDLNSSSLGTSPRVKISPVKTSTGSQGETKTEPQQLASMHLVDQANTFLEQGKIDQAISTLEQSIQVDVYNGDAFYGLAKAWRIKGDFEKALEFANKAGVLYKDNPSKLRQVYRFQADIHMVLNEYEKAELYRKKASEL